METTHLLHQLAGKHFIFPRTIGYGSLQKDLAATFHHKGQAILPF